MAVHGATALMQTYYGMFGKCGMLIDKEEYEKNAVRNIGCCLVLSQAT